MPERLRGQKAAQVTVWTWNLEAFGVFCDCSSQWRYIQRPMNDPVAAGIDRTALESVMRMLGVENQRETLLKVQQIEAGALEVMRASHA